MRPKFNYFSQNFEMWFFFNVNFDHLIQIIWKQVYQVSVKKNKHFGNVLPFGVG